jgi:type IV pilus assembly protein PilF
MARAIVTWLAAVLFAGALAVAEADEKVDLKKAAEANAQLALTYLKQGELAAARDKIEKALKQDPNTAATQMAAGFVYDRLGETRKAGDHFERAVKLDRDNADVLNNAAVYLCRSGDRQKGEEYFLRAAKSPLYRTPEVAYSNAGRCARADGRPTDAEKYFRESLAIRPNQPDVLLEMAELMHQAGNNLSARAFLQRYAASAPATAESLLLGFRIEAAMGDPAAAAEYAARLRAEFPTSPQAGRLDAPQGNSP